MEARIIDRITFELDTQAMLKRLHLSEDSEYAASANRLAGEARAVARPKAMYKEAYVEEKGEDWVVVDGIRFTSRVLRVNLDRVHRVFPYVATCGRELMQWADRIEDPLEDYWADEIMVMALGCARTAVREAIVSDFTPGKTAAMNPGSLEDWPLQQQVNLMELLGDPYAAIGLELTASCLMVPVKSISGIAFPTEFGWENCQLCQRAECPGRRAPYDRELHEQKYGGGTKA